MKKIRGILLAIMLGMLLSMLGNTEKQGRQEEYRQQLTFISPLPWNDAAAGLEKAGREEKSYVKLVSNRVIHYEKMAEAIRAAIYSEADGIIVAGAVPEPQMVEAVNEAAQKEIPVVLMDNDLEGAQRISYIGNDNYQAGQLAGQDIKLATGGKARIGIVVSYLDMQNQKERMNGFFDEIEDSPQLQVIEVVECHSDKLLVMEKVSEMLLEHPEIDALFLAEGCASDVVGELLDEEQIQELCIVAFDGNKVLDYVEQGLYYATLKSRMQEQGIWTVRELKNYAEGKPVEDEVRIKVWHATQENVEKIKEEAMEEAGEFQWQYY